MGYTPLFDSLTKGTLCGRWPDIGLWPIVLSMSDKNGSVDVTAAYIAGVTGLPLSEVEACMRRFCEPDPYSRSQDVAGARLVLLDEHRDWGWRVVNHEKYREKARKAAYDATRTESGADAERKRAARAVPTRPAMTRDDPLSNTNTNTNTNTNKKNISVAPLPKQKHANEFAIFKSIYPKRSGSQPWNKAYKALSARLDGGVVWGEIEAGALRYANWCRETGKVGTEFVMQAARFLGPEQQFLLAWDLPASKADVRLAGNLSAAEEFMQRTEATA